MTESESLESAAKPAGPSTLALAKSIRALRIWLIVLTVFVALGAFGMIAVGAIGVIGITTAVGEADSYGGITDQHISEVKDQIAAAYSNRAENVIVKAVKMDGGAPFPFSVISGAADEAVYAQYRLRGSGVTFANVLYGPVGDDPASSGMLPTQGILTSRMTIAQLDRLLVAYAAQSKAPLGSVKRYDDNLDFVPGESPKPPATVTVGGKTYRTSELWSATEGRFVHDSDVKFDDLVDDSRKAFIFYEDRKSGQFVFLGTEPTQTDW